MLKRNYIVVAPISTSINLLSIPKLKVEVITESNKILFRCLSYLYKHVFHEVELSQIVENRMRLSDT